MHTRHNFERPLYPTFSVDPVVLVIAVFHYTLLSAENMYECKAPLKPTKANVCPKSRGIAPVSL